MSFNEIANSPQLFVICGAALLVVVAILVIYMAMGWKRGLELGMGKDTLLTAVKSTLAVSVGPLLSILVPLFALIRVAWR